MSHPQKTISYLFYTLFFFTPLILWPFTSEIFEFNKMVFVYTITVVIAAAWAVRCILEQRLIFRRTILDIPLLIFLGSQFVSTLFSIDPHTSIFGYYSRFNGGLLSTISYALLYWAFVSNMDARYTLYAIRYTLISATLVSIYGILQRFGIDKDVWVQDVQNRVFSTLGQPNWLAAFLVALIPLTFTNIIKKPYSYILSLLFFITLLFTKSRSGLLGFAVAAFIYWVIILTQNFKGNTKPFLIFSFSFLILFFVIGNPYLAPKTESVPTAPALEVGGTESGDIRKIVWKGAIEIWRNYPVFGTGPETFAYAYPRFRPVEHNLVSEWDFIYNKAHNEYLNLLANTGILGVLSYLIVIFVSLLAITNFQLPIFNKFSVSNFQTALLAGYVSLLITNFFGFSVVPTQLLLFLFPAFVITLND